MRVSNGLVQQLGLICPVCHGTLAESPSSFTCECCGRTFPVLFGIPDFRLDGDRYLSLAEERAKAEILFERSRTMTFRELVDYYYAITSDVPPALARLYAGYVDDAPSRAIGVIDRFGGLGPKARLLDVGCGSGGMELAARNRFQQVVGLDIALRWLVICRKRLDEAGVEGHLICADVHALPFEDGRFSHISAVDLLEHVRDPREALAQIHRTMQSGGSLWLSASNRFCIGPHPSVGVWGIGFLPGLMRTRVLQWLRGVDSLRHVTLVWPNRVRSWSLEAGFRLLASEPRDVNPQLARRRGVTAFWLAAIYARVRHWPVVKQLLLAVGPAFEMLLQKVNAGEKAGVTMEKRT